jgi:hypothetical protein
MQSNMSQRGVSFSEPVVYFKGLSGSSFRFAKGFRMRDDAA